MRILFVTPYYKPYLGGIERVVEELSQAFLKHNQVSKVGVLTTKWVFPSNPRNPRQYLDHLPDAEMSNGLHVFRLGSFPRVAPPFYQVPLVWFSPQKIKQIINHFDPDVIQLMSDRWFWGNLGAWWFSDHRQVVFSLSFHQLERGQQSRLPLWLLKQSLRPINAFLTRHVDWVHAITHHERSLVEKAYWTPPQKFKIIPWGTKIKNTPISSSKFSLSEKRKIKILAVGRISKHKGQKWLAERYLEAQLKMPSELILVGKTSDEKYLQEIYNLKPKTKDKNILVTGEVSDEQLTHHYQTADIFALFPEYEAFGLVFLEAMSQGLPVITHNVGAVKEVLQEGALIVPQYDSTAATLALERLVNHPANRLSLGRQAHRYVIQNFSWEKTAEKFIQAYRAHFRSPQNVGKQPQSPEI